MMNLPYEVIAQRIMEESGISQSELEKKIKSKLEQLSGLISKEGAAHIVANELGINLLQAKGLLKIKNLIAGMKNVEIAGKVLRKYETRSFKTEKREGKLSKFLVGDETGTTMVVLWNDHSAIAETFSEGNIIRINNSNVRENNGRLELHLADTGSIEVNPEGISISVKEYKNSYSDSVTRKKISELTPSDLNAEIFVTIVQVFDPKFFEVCPECGKRVKSDEGNFSCGEHGKVTPSYGAVLNIFADDGSDNMRVVLWKNQILELINVDEGKLINYKNNPSTFDEVKTDLLGKMVKFHGRVANNELFGRLEFVANKVFTSVNAEDELKSLNEKTSASKSESAKISQENKISGSSQVVSGQTFSPNSTSSHSSESNDLADDLLSLEDLEDLDDE